MSREVKTYKDLQDLFTEYDVILAQKGTEVLVLFAGDRGGSTDQSDIFDGIDPKYLEPGGMKLAEQNGADYILMSRLSRYAIRTLVSSPEFWRKTTVASHVDCLRFHPEIFVGASKTYKKRDTELTIVFDNEKNAKKFMRRMKYYEVDNIRKRFHCPRRARKQIKQIL